MASWDVVLVVGARLLGHASFSIGVIIVKSDFFDKKELLFDVIAMIVFFLNFIDGINSLISFESPLFERHIITSSYLITPRSP